MGNRGRRNRPYAGCPLPPPSAVLGAFFILQSTGAITEFDGTPPEDGDRISNWTDAGSAAIIWGDGSEFGPSEGPRFENAVGDQINGNPILDQDLTGGPLFATPADFTQTSVTAYVLMDKQAGVAGDETLWDNGSGGTVRCRLYMDRAGQVGYQSGGSNVDISAAAAGLQVLAWRITAGGVAEVFRDVGSGPVSLGTSATVDAVGYDWPGPCFFLGESLGANKPSVHVVEAWLYKMSHTAAQVAQQCRFLRSRGGL